MNDDQLLQFSRHILLPDFDVDGQEKLLQAKVLLVGAGGLGSPIALYLAAAGIGHITIIDDDLVDISNLQRQIAHQVVDVGMNKAVSAAQAMQNINPACAVIAVSMRLDEQALAGQVANVDIIIDATDNAETRFLLNDLSYTFKTPLVSGAAIRWEGQVTVFDPRRPQSPCYRCLYPSEQTMVEENCSESGVISPLVGVIGSMQALEAIKLLSGVGEPLVGKVLFYDGKFGQWQQIALSKLASCPVCASSSAS